MKRSSNPHCFKQKQHIENEPHSKAKNNNDDINFPNTPNKRQNSESKLIGFNRIMPKMLVQDKQFLYSQNLSLKQKIKQKNEQNIRLKTRIFKCQNQKQKMLTEIEKLASYQDFKLLRKQAIQVQKSHSIPLNRFLNENNSFNKKLYRQVKEQLERLKNENNRLKKLVKYTEINQLKIQNEALLEQLGRIHDYSKRLLHVNQNIEQLAIIENQKIKIKIKQQNRCKNYQSEIKQKDEQIKLLKQKIIITQKNNEQINQKFKQQIQHLKNYIRESEKSSFKAIKQRSSSNHYESNSFKGIFHNKIDYSIDKLSKKGNIIEQNAQFKEQQNQNKSIINRRFYLINKNNKYQLSTGRNRIDRFKKFNKRQIQIINKIKNVPSFTKEQKQLLKETLTYKFKSQSYTIKDLQKDIFTSNIKQFTIQQIISIFLSQPFYLNNHQSYQLAKECFSNINLITNKKLIKLLKEYISQYKEQNEAMQSQRMKKIAKIFKENQILLIKKIQEQSQEYFAPEEQAINVISKEKLSKILRQLKMDNECIDICIGQFSVMSSDTEHLNYKYFLNSMIKNRSQSNE